jgi:hypothetical protein
MHALCGAARAQVAAAAPRPRAAAGSGGGGGGGGGGTAQSTSCTACGEARGAHYRFVPCGHSSVLLCAPCASSLVGKPCPAKRCRDTVTAVRKAPRD